MTETTETKLDKIDLILLDNKVVKYPVSFNENEGWVEMKIPVQMSEGVTYKTGDLISAEDPDINQFHWETVRREGKVKIVYSDSSPTED
jgi:hypothetical protein